MTHFGNKLSLQGPGRRLEPLLMQRMLAHMPVGVRRGEVAVTTCSGILCRCSAPHVGNGHAVEKLAWHMLAKFDQWKSVREDQKAHTHDKHATDEPSNPTLAACSCEAVDFA